MKIYSFLSLKKNQYDSEDLVSSLCVCIYIYIYIIMKLAADKKTK